MNIRTFRPSYLVPRIRQYLWQTKHPDAPWLTHSAVRILESWLRPTDVGIEWGSGRSTIWFARRVGSLLSVEDNQEWFQLVSGRLKEAGLAGKVDYRFVPTKYSELDEPAADAYADTIDTIKDGGADFILVDGQIRYTCMRKAMLKLKSGGLLVLDNANRFIPNPSLGGFSTIHESKSQALTKNWERLVQDLIAWRAILTTDKIWDTRMWVKP